MSTLVTSKGQVTIPKKVRDHLGIRPGTAVEFEPTPDGRAVLTKAAPRRAARRKPGRFAALRGTATVQMSTEEIMALTRGED
jgi:AbrB family looped-hinge helix DNA binding protein